MKKALSVLVPVLLALALYGVMLRFAPLWISIACMSIFTIAGMAQAIAAAFSLAGTVGNFYDRIVFHGVRDFLYFYKIDWPVFNVADCCLVVGASLLLVQALLIAPRNAATAAPQAVTSDK